MPTSIVRKNSRSLLLLGAIGFDTDKAILDIFDLADEVKLQKKNWKNPSAVNWPPGYCAAGQKTS
jgi:hypothetical protein